MGSSASSWKSQIVGTVGAAIASSAGVAVGSAITAGSGGVAAPLGIAIAGAGISVASNIYSRSEESKAEVFSNYKSRVFNNADNAGITDKVLENAKKQLIAANKNNAKNFAEPNIGSAICPKKYMAKPLNNKCIRPICKKALLAKRHGSLSMV